MINQDDTIAAIATPLGEGGLGIIRLSGPNAIKIADTIFQSISEPLSKTQTHSLKIGWIQSGKDRIDQVVASLFKKPHSYTGEDIIEFSCHGSPYILKEILGICTKGGARLADPGEFTYRAYLNGKIDLLQAEAVADLIHSTSQRGRRIALSHLQGGMSKRVNGIRNRLTDLLAQTEANLDFVEEDIPNLPKEQMKEQLANIERDIENLLAVSLKCHIIRDGIRVAIVGRANTGKSSLFNALLAQERAIVTNIPGTTRDVIEEKLLWEGFTIVLSDTAGYKKSRGRLDQLGLERTEKAQSLAQLVLMVLDGSRPISAEDKRILYSIGDKKTVVIINKCDKKLVTTPEKVRQAWGKVKVVITSALTGDGLAAVKNAVSQTFKKMLPESEDSDVLTNMRHIHHLEKAQKSLQIAQSDLDRNRTEETITLSIREAAEELGTITGHDVTEAILDSIFKHFCVGK